MLLDLLGSLKKNKEVITILVIGSLLVMHNTNSVLDRFVPVGGNNRNPSGMEDVATKAYVDSRLAEMESRATERSTTILKGMERQDVSLQNLYNLLMHYVGSKPEGLRKGVR